MNTSESISKIAPALLQAQRSITFAVKDAKNPQFKTMYADLPAVIDAVKPALNDAGIVFLQMMAPSDKDCLALTTRLIHESGEWIESTATCPLQKADPQGYGSACTYLKRYSLASAVGLYQDDDDGHAASQASSGDAKHKAEQFDRRQKFLADTFAAIQGASNAGELKRIVAETTERAHSIGDQAGVDQINGWAEAKAAKAKPKTAPVREGEPA